MTIASTTSSGHRRSRMGRKQRTGSKSIPVTGVQWANWLDNPAGGPVAVAMAVVASEISLCTALTERYSVVRQRW